MAKVRTKLDRQMAAIKGRETRRIRENQLFLKQARSALKRAIRNPQPRTPVVPLPPDQRQSVANLVMATYMKGPLPPTKEQAEDYVAAGITGDHLRAGIEKTGKAPPLGLLAWLSTNFP